MMVALSCSKRRGGSQKGEGTIKELISFICDQKFVNTYAVQCHLALIYNIQGTCTSPKGDHVGKCV